MCTNEAPLMGADKLHWWDSTYGVALMSGTGEAALMRHHWLALISGTGEHTLMSTGWQCKQITYCLRHRTSPSLTLRLCVREGDPALFTTVCWHVIGHGDRVVNGRCDWPFTPIGDALYPRHTAITITSDAHPRGHAGSLFTGECPSRPSWNERAML